MTPWLSEREKQAWVGLLQLTGRLQAEMNRQLAEEHDISVTDYEVLGRLHESTRGGLRIRELTETLAWEQSRLSHHLVRMQKRGLVERQQCLEDRRGTLFVLTDRGRRVIEQAAPSHVRQVRRLLLDHLTTEQVDQLAAITARGLDALRTVAAPS